MSGFVLGTGSGILAAAAVYYTLSSDLERSTSGLRSELHASSALLNQSFNPTPPPAHSSLVGPSSTAPYVDRPFGALLREKWNDALSGAVENVRKTDWSAVGSGAYQAGQNVYQRVVDVTPSQVEVEEKVNSVSSDIKEKAQDIKEDVKDVLKDVKDETKALGKEIKEDSKKLPEQFNNTVLPGGLGSGIDLKKNSIGTVSGNEFVTKVKRNAEEKGGRLV